MKKNLTIVISIIISLLAAKTNQSNAQSFYFGLIGGYGLSAASQNIATETSYVNSTLVYSYDDKMVKGSFGEGINTGIVVGDMINSKIGIELSINYLIGKKFAGSEDDHRTYSKKYQSAVTMLRLTPGLKLTTGSEKTNAYARAGMILGLGGKKKYLEDYDYKTNGVVTQKIYHEVNLTGGLSIGFMGALGVEVPLGGSCKFFTELNFISQSWAPTNGKTTTFTVDGIDKLSTLNTREKETNYVSSYSYSSSQYDPNQPSKYLKTYLPMSSIGLNFGLHLMLGKKKSN